MPRVLICDPIARSGVDKLLKAGFIVDFKPDLSTEKLLTIIPNYDAVIVRSRTKITKKVIDCGIRLKFIGRAGIGLDNIDLKAAEKRGIKVANTPEAPADSTAELTIGLIISLLRKIPIADSTMKKGLWLKAELKGRLLKGKVLGLVGLGNVGLRVARIAKAFGMKILFTKRTPPKPRILQELEAEFVSLEDLLKRSDIISLHVPLTDETRGMIGEREINVMKDGAVLINTSRGAIIDERALIKALKSGKLAGAALDVYEVEPPNNLTLIKMPNVICTPHIGAQTEEAQIEASNTIAEKIIEHFIHNRS
ncbi:TPA: hydroxyacid dehydrogenase [Candidatus Bathyarchaeota archaeon]|nr:hydroxyacid dehydrogenase [Candidatus Bathyarchaeota archaeon]